MGNVAKGAVLVALTVGGGGAGYAAGEALTPPDSYYAQERWHANECANEGLSEAPRTVEELPAACSVYEPDMRYNGSQVVVLPAREVFRQLAEQRIDDEVKTDKTLRILTTLFCAAAGLAWGATAVTSKRRRNLQRVQ